MEDALDAGTTGSSAGLLRGAIERGRLGASSRTRPASALPTWPLLASAELLLARVAGGSCCGCDISAACPKAAGCCGG